MTYVDLNGIRSPHGTGYSGRGDGLNNPNMQDVPHVGPIPRGTYFISPMEPVIITQDGTRLLNAMRLTPDAATQAYLKKIGRGGFIMHGGDFEEMDSSTGCPIIRPNERSNVARSRVNFLRVVQ